MVGSEADDDDGDEFERALGRSLDLLAAGAASPAGNPGTTEQTAEQLAEAMAMQLSGPSRTTDPPAGGRRRSGQ